MSLNEADTCREHVTPALDAAGWRKSPHALKEQHNFTDGRIHVTGNRAVRGTRKKADYVLQHTRDIPIAVVEAKDESHTPGAGLQQAKDYAEILGLKFAYSTNGHGIVEFDYITGAETALTAFPTPDALWARLTGNLGLNIAQSQRLATPSYTGGGYELRYYQQIAVNRVISAILSGDRRVLLTMATGTGKTKVAFQICWRLSKAKWNRAGDGQAPRILYLSDRTMLVDDPMAKDFRPFGDGRLRIENGEANLARQVYFSTYQAVAEDQSREGLFRQFPRDFFDLIVVDECHRGSAGETSPWKDILLYFGSAAQLGMTATPRRDVNADTYDYFGIPIYTYSLRQGIDDGFLAPYRVLRVVPTVDATGWRPTIGQMDANGRLIPDHEYGTPDFGPTISHLPRTEAIARHLSDFLTKTDRFAKTMVFCVDQEEAETMRTALVNLNKDITSVSPDYVCRVTADEGGIGKGHLSRFQDVETQTPTILTTSQLLSTGVDAPTCRNIVIARMVNSMVEFKQIIGRGTRVREDCDKLYFTILDYTGSATSNFADPDFDGDPAVSDEEQMDDEGVIVEGVDPPEKPGVTVGVPPPPPYDTPQPRKFYVKDGETVGIATELQLDLDKDGRRLAVTSITDLTARTVREMAASDAELRRRWADKSQRDAVLAELNEAGLDLDALAAEFHQPDADPLDLLCHVAWSIPVRTRGQRAAAARAHAEFFQRYSPRAREVLQSILKTYEEHGPREFVLPDIFRIPPLSEYGNPSEIATLFGGPKQLKEAVDQLQAIIYE
ncbi:MAG TPA: DEAD/DEAH box helicase family protein [Armatimonadota bacterium]